MNLTINAAGNIPAKHLKWHLLVIGVIFSVGCSSLPDLTKRPPAMLIGGETAYLAVDLDAPAQDVERQLNGHSYLAVELTMRCPLGGEEFTATLRKQTMWTKISLGGVFFTDPNIPGANVPDPWPVPQCPSNGFPVSKLIYAESDLNDLQDVFSQPFFQMEAAKHVSSYVVYRGLLARSIDDGLACTKANRVRLAAIEARYLWKPELESSYNDEAIEHGRACLTLTNLSAESHIQHVAAHINQLRLVGRFGEAKDAIVYLRDRYSNQQIDETPGNSFNSLYPTIGAVLSKVEELIDDRANELYVVSMRNPVTVSNPLLDEYRKLLSIQGSIKSAN